MNTDKETIPFCYLRLSECKNMIVQWNDNIILVTPTFRNGSYFKVTRDEKKPAIVDIFFGIDETDTDEPNYLKITDKNCHTSIIKFEL